MVDADTGTSHVTLSVPMDGYDVEVKVAVATIKREIKRAEREGSRLYADEGPRTLNLSKYATVRAEPTDEKWGELADAQF